MSNEAIRALLTAGHCVGEDIKREVTDAQWADFGRMVSNRIFHSEDFAYVLTHGALKAKSTHELLGIVRAYLLTGAKR